VRIAYFVSRFPQQCQTFIRREINEVVRNGHDVTIFPVVSAAGGSKRQASDVCACTSVIYTPLSVRQLWHVLKTSPRPCFKMMGFLLSDTWYRPQMFVKSCIALARGLCASTIIRDEGYDHIHAHWASYPATAAMAVSKLSGIPFSFAFHAYDLFATRIALKQKLSATRFAVLNSQYSVAFLMRWYPGAPADKLMLLYNGLTPDRFADAPRVVPSVVECPHILAVGRLVSTKGFETLVDACGLLSDEGRAFRVTLIGSGPNEEGLRRLIHQRGLESCVTLTGELLQSDVRGYLAEADVVVVPCVAPRCGASHDALPNVVIEAQAAGIPVVASNLFAIPETVRHEETGLLFAPGDASALKLAMGRLMDDPELATRLARQALEEARGRFDVHANVGRLLDRFQRVGEDGSSRLS